MNQSIVQLTNISKHYGALKALNNITLNIPQGEALGLFGHNGAGKTTMMKLILGVIDPDAGQIEVMGTSPNSSNAFELRKNIGYLPENVSFYEQLTGKEVLTYLAKLKGFNKQTAISLLEQVGISDAMNRQVKTYSKGMRQRLGLAQAFIGEPKLLILDEPTVGLDPMATKEFYHTLDQLKNKGCSVILCSHVLPGVEQHIDRAMILSKGKQLALGSIQDLCEQANLPVQITPEGLNGSLLENSELASFINNQKDISLAPTLLVPEQEKLGVLRQLLAYQSLSNIQIKQASLEQVYQYYLTKTQPQKKANANTGKEH